MNAGELESQVLDALTEVAPEVVPGNLDPQASFRDQFDFDSVDYLNFVLGLERRLGVRIPESDYPRLSSLSGAVDYLQRGTEASRP